MAYSVLDLPMQTALGGNENCEDCAAIVADVTYDPCNFEKSLDADDVLFGFLKCDAVFTKDGGVGVREPLDALQPNPNDVQSFTDLITAGDAVIRKTQDFEKAQAEALTRALSAYKPEDVMKYRQNFSWVDTRRLADASEAQLVNQLLAWSTKGVLQSFYVTKHDDCFMYRAETKLVAGHGQSPAAESIEQYNFSASVMIPKNSLIVPFRISGLFQALQALAL